MRFKAATNDELPKWLAIPLLVLLSPLWLSFIGLLWIDHNGLTLKRKWLGPRVGQWQCWFAWHPVRLDGGWGDTVWLEPVYRQAIGSSYSNAIVYAASLPDA